MQLIPADSVPIFAAVLIEVSRLILLMKHVVQNLDRYVLNPDFEKIRTKPLDFGKAIAYDFDHSLGSIEIRERATSACSLILSTFYHSNLELWSGRFFHFLIG